MEVLNGSFILAVLNKEAVLAGYSLIKKSGSNNIAVILLSIQYQTGVAVVYKLVELNDRWVLDRMTVNTPNWFKGLPLPVSRFW